MQKHELMRPSIEYYMGFLDRLYIYDVVHVACTICSVTVWCVWSIMVNMKEHVICIDFMRLNALIQFQTKRGESKRGREGKRTKKHHADADGCWATTTTMAYKVI